MPIRQLTDQPEILLGLEPEELAGFVLQDLNERTDRGEDQTLNRHNYINELNRTVRDHRPEILRAVTEAWTWLDREGLIATNPEQGPEWIFVTRRGRRLANREAFTAFRHASRLPRGQLHPLVADRVWPAFLHGDCDTAVFQAFREVEVAVRGAAGLAPDDFGVNLMRRAFGLNGPLADPGAPEAEREAWGHLFAGHLLRIVDDRAARRAR
jgi:hypothetical protein